MILNPPARISRSERQMQLEFETHKFRRGLREWEEPEPELRSILSTFLRSIDVTFGVVHA